MDEQRDGRSSPVLTVPNVLSGLRILLIPVFVLLILDHDTTTAGLLLFGAILATDWVDGVVARRTGQVTELGKVLDPVADRLAIAAGLLALAARHAFPWWAALLILARDGIVVLVGLAVLAVRRVRLDVRFLGKAATFALMAAIGWVAWGNLGLPLRHLALAFGWCAFGIGIAESYVATVAYAGDVRRAFSEPVPTGR
jgi:cardiolipin synthase